MISTDTKRPYRLIISGNSRLANEHYFTHELGLYLQHYNIKQPIQVITGMLGATDTWAVNIAAEKCWQCFQMTPSSAANARDLYRRNERMASLAQGLLLFVEELDRPSKHLLDAAHFQKLNVRCIHPTQFQSGFTSPTSTTATLS